MANGLRYGCATGRLQSGKNGFLLTQGQCVVKMEQMDVKKAWVDARGTEGRKLRSRGMEGEFLCHHCPYWEIAFVHVRCTPLAPARELAPT